MNIQILHLVDGAKKEKIKIQDIMLMTVDAAGNHTIIRKDYI